MPAGLRNNCTFCGVFRRQALDRGALLAGADKIVTGEPLLDSHSSSVRFEGYYNARTIAIVDNLCRREARIIIAGVV